MQITVLTDNQAMRDGTIPGHGLAMLVEAEGIRVLFDTGPDDTIIANAATLGVRLDPLDAIVLSHGHYDHTGGLAAVLAAVGPGPVKVVAHPGVFDSTYSGPGPGQLRPIGMPLEREAYEALGAVFELSEMPVALGDVLMTTGHVPPLHPLRRAGLWRNREAVPYPDDFRDDCSLVARLGRSSALLTGCAHAGLRNILYKAQTIVPDGPPRVVVGGLHLGAADDDEIREVAAEAYSLGVRTILPCHCTGDRAAALLQECFAGKVVAIGTGSIVTFGPHGKVAVTTK